MRLPHILSRSREVRIDLDHYLADKLKSAARFWVGKEAAKFNKQKSISTLTRVFNGKNAAKKVALQLTDKQKRVLEIFARFGPVVSGPLLFVELHQRGLVERPDDSSRSYYEKRRNDVVNGLREKLVLVSSGYDYYGYSYDRRYPELALHPAIAEAIEPAPPLSWEPSKPVSNVQGLPARNSAEPALDLWRVAEALREMGKWNTVKGDALSKGSRNKLRRMTSLPSADDAPLALPDPESFYYELLREMGFLSVTMEPRRVLIALLEQHFAEPAVTQAWHWLRAWLDIRLWQDGIGVVPDRDNDYEPVRIEPGSLRKTKELLIWAFCCLAHTDCDWFDLEVFLKDFWHATHEAESGFYWEEYTWNPDFVMARSKRDFAAGPDRSVAFWLDGAGVWAANVVMVTFVMFGLVQRGQSGGKKKCPCFRLTDLGRRVFGMPETEAEDRHDAAPFLTVQPNHEVLAYMDAADARRICTLARFARHDKVNTGPVQTFSLSRESVYQALENGMSVAEIQAFLVEHGRTDLPANVAHALMEWSGKRESLVLRNGVTLGLLVEAAEAAELPTSGELLGDHCVVMKKRSEKMAMKDFAGWAILDHHAGLPKAWSVDELGRLQDSGEDTVSCMRLACLADQTADGWLISAKSITRARKQGFMTDQMLVWLSTHLLHATPALLETAIRNWTGRASAFAGKVHLLQLTRGSDCDAILGSDVFRPLLAGHIPPCWFIVQDDKAGEVKRLLLRLGFRIDASFQLACLDEGRSTRAGREPLTKTKRRKRR